MSRIRLFGLSIASELPLPDISGSPDDREPDVFVRLGRGPGEADLIVPDVAQYWVRDGREIHVDVSPAVPLHNVRLFLLGSAMGLLLQQRGLLPLHANAIGIEGRALVVAGEASAGKSTLAAWLMGQGHSLLADDVCVVGQGESGPLVRPGLPWLRLWGDALLALGRTRQGLARAYAGDEEDKWEVPAATVDQPLPLDAIYFLTDGPAIAITPVGGAAAAELLFAHTYRGAFVAPGAVAEAHWTMVTWLMERTPTYRLERPRDLSALGSLGRALISHATRK